MALVEKEDVTCVEFDRLSSNTLSMGDVKGMVTVHDFDSNSEIMHIETNQGVVRCLKWHPQTRDVMIAGSEKGCALLNTRKSKKPLMNIVDPSGRQNVSGLCWHESMRSVVITYDSFGRPNSTNHHLSHHGSSSGGSVVQLWDLRHTNAPYAEFGSFHQRGIIGIETSRIDPRFFMTCSREGRGILWAMSGPSIVPYAELDVKTPIDDFYLSQGSGLPLVCLKHANTNTEETSVNTSPAQSTKSPFLSFHDIDAHTLPDSHVVHDASNSIKFTPKWMNSGASLDFGFGGKLAWFTPSNDQDVAGISNVCSDELFIESINQVFQSTTHLPYPIHSTHISFSTKPTLPTDPTHPTYSTLLYLLYPYISKVHTYSIICSSLLTWRGMIWLVIVDIVLSWKEIVGVQEQI